MPQAYPHFGKRVVHPLDGLWDFTFLEDADVAALNLKSIAYHDRMPVPAAFDAMPAYAGKRGVGVYRRYIQMTPGCAGRLRFEAVSMWCRVYVDGQLLKEHLCGYSGFWVDVPPSQNSRREIVVMTDNRFDFARNPLHEEFFDFYQWGGIIRSAWLYELPSAWIKHVTVRVLNHQAGQISIDVECTGAAEGPTTITTRIDENSEQIHRVSLANGHATLSIHIPNPESWSPQHPKLYRLQVMLEHDDWIGRFGLREIQTRGHQILLNGAPLKLAGYNRHESHPQFGPALPYNQLVADLQYLRDLGCNFIRGCHYPQDQRFLDLCDEMGFLVWEESLGWGQGERQLTDVHFMAEHAAMVEEMVTTSCNHPCVIMWGFLNEAKTSDASIHPIFDQTVRQFRKLDPTRPITYASMFPENDLYWDLVDIISVNMYPGWYGCAGNSKPLDMIVPFIHKILHLLENSPQRDKPFIISEIGVEALYGWRDAHHDFFTEEFQSEYLRRVCTEFVNNPQINGLAIWHFSDARTYSGGYALGRPRAFNNKGTLDEYRRPKQSYYTVKNIFSSLETGSIGVTTG